MLFLRLRTVLVYGASGSSAAYYINRQDSHPACFGMTADVALELPVALLHSAFDLAACVALCHIVALVVELLALAEPDLHLDAGVLEIHGHRNKRVAALLHLTEQLEYLLLCIRSFRVR